MEFCIVDGAEYSCKLFTCIDSVLHCLLSTVLLCTLVFSTSVDKECGI